MFQSTTTTPPTSGFSVFVGVFALLQHMHICTPRFVFAMVIMVWTELREWVLSIEQYTAGYALAGVGWYVG